MAEETKTKTPEEHQPISHEPAPLPQKSSGSKVWMIIAVIAIILLVGLGIYGYMKVKNLNNQISSQQAQITELQNNKKTLEDAAAAAAASAAKTVVNSVQTSDAEKIKQAVTDKVNAQVGVVAGKDVIISTAKFSPNKEFASVGVNQNIPGGGPGYEVILKKVNNDWVIVFEGQQMIPDTQKRYGIPDNF